MLSLTCNVLGYLQCESYVMSYFEQIAHNPCTLLAVAAEVVSGDRARDGEEYE